MSLENLLKEIRQCHRCVSLPLGPNPVLQVHSTAKILIIGQAPGIRVHQSSIPWNDPSGDRLRQWMGISRDIFYDKENIAIMPMAFCYPGTGKSGDLPPPPLCATTWHECLLEYLPHVELCLLVGQYAQKHYLESPARTLTENVKQWKRAGPKYFPLPHPSPRNNIWLKKNSWFEKEVLPALYERIHALL